MGNKQSEPKPLPPPPENEMLKNLELAAEVSENPIVKNTLSNIMGKKMTNQIQNFLKLYKTFNGKTDSNEFGKSNGSSSFGGIDMGVLDNLEGFSNMLFGKSHMKRKVRRNKTKGKKSNVKKSKKH